MLAVLLLPFGKANNVKIDVVSVGKDKALKLAENGDVDVVIVHSRPAEDKFVSDGHGVDRKDVNYDDYILMGPKSDPARVKGLKIAVKAFKSLAESKAEFISLGDDSGSHRLEKALWKETNIALKGKWYVESGHGMGAAIQMAFDKQVHPLADRGT